ncbi:peptide chain release factor N(5)-glutamine methyltransferase [Pseudoclavibacter albus]|uniref:peptide chain release factor N(5)-glutamine methyltransferase n=1 Tax=Pseudoclavibacter albus TaxID=272241 RepID=UPI0030B9A144
MDDLRLIRDRARRTLAAAGLTSPSEADILLSSCLGMSRGELELALLRGDAIDADTKRRLEDAVERRRRREPLQHITGRAPFWDMELEVGPGVFVPRPETELLVELALTELAELGSTDAPGVLEFCAGSGAIALALARALPRSRVVTVEASPEAWPWLRRNVARYGDGRVEARFGRLEEPSITTGLEQSETRPAVIVSNPPYIPSRNVPQDPEVRRADPEEALFSGEDGLDLIRAILERSEALLPPGGALFLEHDESQGPAIRALFAARGWHDPSTHQDLLGRDRVSRARRPGAAK